MNERTADTTPRPSFGFAVPTATEGMMYPMPFADIDEAVDLAVEAERLGFDSVWGNDHMSTQRYVREKFPDPPRFYDPLTYLAFVAARTTTLRIATCVLVLPFRHPVEVAKQAATLDLLSNGRLILGVGIGAYREEFEAMWPGRKAHRGDITEESIRSLRLLFDERVASFRGKYVSFEDVESYPKPIAAPILSGGNSAGTRRRAALYGDGWLPAALTPQEVSEGIREIRAVANEGGRELPHDFDIALQVAVAIGNTEDDAVQRFETSQIYAHMRSLSRSTLRGKQGAFRERNLIGTPNQICERIEAYRQAGVTTFAGLLFAADTVAETKEALSLFSREVIESFRDDVAVSA